jgi:hypothetical protein
MTTLTLQEVFAKQAELATPHSGDIYANPGSQGPKNREEDIQRTAASSMSNFDLQEATEIVDRKIANYAKHTGQAHLHYCYYKKTPGNVLMRIIKIWEDEVPAFCEKYELDYSRPDPVSEKFIPYVTEKVAAEA